MRDYLVTAAILATIPFILRRPHIGALVWVFISIVNPHRSTWGFAYDFPFAYTVAVATLIGIGFSKERKNFPFSAVMSVLLLFLLWISLSTFFAWSPEDAVDKWARTMKIQAMLLVTIWLINSRERLHQLVWVIVVSLGIYGVKGGFFTIVTGGQHIIFGPAESFIESNNSLAVALIMTLPLMGYLYMQSKNRWVRRGLSVAMLLLGFAVLGSQSRGAFLAVGAMLALLWWKSNRKAMLGLALSAAALITLMFMPQQYFERMQTIKTYQQDGSAMGRINAWKFAYNVAEKSPLVGGGFKVFSPKWFLIYAPNPTDFHDAHSIYFEVLGEQGFVGLFLFLLMWALTLRTGSMIIRLARQEPEWKWAHDLAAMTQVSIFGYLVGGAFLGLAYWDLPYYLLAFIVILHRIVSQNLKLAAPTGGHALVQSAATDNAGSRKMK